jgi:hypothetical protein
MGFKFGGQGTLPSFPRWYWGVHTRQIRRWDTSIKTRHAPLQYDTCDTAPGSIDVCACFGNTNT